LSQRDTLGAGGRIVRGRCSCRAVTHVDLQSGPQGSQWGAEFMGGVGDEAALPICGGLDPPEQIVEGVREPAQLILGNRGVEATVQIGAGDRGGLAAHDLDRL
jgi:hypothetical protein